MKDISTLWSNLHKTFYERHILAHESATQFVMTYEKAFDALSCVSLIIETTEAVLWSTVWKDEPLTQFEMNNAAWEKYQHARGNLAKALRGRRRVADTNLERSRFRKLHFRWKSWTTDWCEFVGDRFMGGSIRPLIQASELTEAFESWIIKVNEATGC